MKSLILGNGEVGKALMSVLCESYRGITYLQDKEDLNYGEQDLLHICFPFSDEFISEVKRYQELYKPKFVVVHSTTPVGICRQLGAIHSPVIGQHPFLEEGIKTFPKMLGGEQSSDVADYFRRAGLKTVLFDKSETTEAAKLFLTEYYRECINFAKRVKNYADKHNLSFSEIYRIPNEIYNEGYKKLGYEEFIRPVLQPIMTPTGGHCVSQNSELIKLSE